jgi:preprotein translocase subunit SecD
LQQSLQGTELTLYYSDSFMDQLKKQAVEKNVEVLRVRLDQIGVAETPIFIQGENRIVIELPDVKDPQQAKNMIGATVHLELCLVEAMDSSEEALLDRFDGELPPDKRILPLREQNSYILTSRYADLTGKYLKDARTGFSGDLVANPVVEFFLTPEGGKKMYDLTSKNVGRNLAIVLDNTVISAPTISTGIHDHGTISGRFSHDEAKELALLLKSGSFMAPVTIEEERQIGPALGQESIRQGFIACVLALLLVFIFCIVFYSVSGLAAFITLLYNLILLLFGLSQLGATLTLPGIAGIVLTVGMAVDASILIFERIRETLRQGELPRDAVKKGFGDSFTVIFDANLTTFLVGVVLYFFGTGPLQGFAVTLMLGIVATLITGLGFQRSLFKFVFDNFSVHKLRI